MRTEVVPRASLVLASARAGLLRDGGKGRVSAVRVSRAKRGGKRAGRGVYEDYSSHDDDDVQ